MNIITDNLLFGIALSLICFEIGLYIYKKTKIAIFNPLLIAILLVIGFILLFNIEIESFNKGGDFINMFLGPATVVLALPLYKQIALFKKHFLAIIIGIFIGSSISILSVIFIGKLFNLDNSIILSLIPKSVTTPIGIEISNNLGGITSVTVLAIVISGIIGAVIGPTVCKIFKIKNSISIGIALGTAAHAVGTSKALEIGETEGAMSSLSIGIAGIITVFLVPLYFNIFSFLLL